VKFFAGIVCLVVVGLFGSILFMGPPRLEQFEEIGANETAFVVPLEGASKSDQGKFMSVDFLEEAKVATKRINIPLRSQKTGRLPGNFKWIPTVKVIRVDRMPVTREWTSDASTGTNTKSEGLEVESKDSIGFNVGINITCSVLEDSAASFLYFYAGKKLTDVVDSNVRGRVQEILSREFGKRDLSRCKEEKADISSTVCEETREFFKSKGITIDYLGIVGGLTYEDKEIQSTINDAFVAENKINIATQDFEAQKINNEKEKTIAETKLFVAKKFAEAQEAAMAQIELEIKKIQAEATLKAADKWSGNLPSNMIPANAPLLFNLGAGGH